ncbi:MAG: HAMP domain-containing protein [Polyangiaceae bacterium]
MKDARVNGPPVYGIGILNGKPYLLASAAIKSTAGTPGKVAGRMITGKHINDAWVHRLAKFTRLDVRLTTTVGSSGSREQPQVSIESDKFIRGTVVLDDLRKRPVITLDIRQERNLVTYGEKILRSSLLAISFGGLLLVLATLRGMKTAVLKPIHSILDAMRLLESGRHVDAKVSSKDELGALAGGFNRMARAIFDREERLADALSEVRLVLDSTGDALLGCSLQGHLVGTPSRAALEWFGAIDSRSIPDYLFADAPTVAATFRLGLDDLAADLMPYELVIDQMPKRISASGSDVRNRVSTDRKERRTRFASPLDY